MLPIPPPYCLMCTESTFYHSVKPFIHFLHPHPLLCITQGEFTCSVGHSFWIQYQWDDAGFSSQASQYVLYSMFVIPYTYPGCCAGVIVPTVSYDDFSVLKPTVKPAWMHLFPPITYVTLFQRFHNSSWCFAYCLVPLHKSFFAYMKPFYSTMLLSSERADLKFIVAETKVMLILRINLISFIFTLLTFANSHLLANPFLNCTFKSTQEVPCMLE